jgi:hypothetical protein
VLRTTITTKKTKLKKYLSKGVERRQKMYAKVLSKSLEAYWRNLIHLSKILSCDRCFINFGVKVGVEESIVNTPRITDHFLRSFTIDSSTPTPTPNLKTHPL